MYGKTSQFNYSCVHLKNPKILDLCSKNGGKNPKKNPEKNLEKNPK